MSLKAIISLSIVISLLVVPLSSVGIDDGGEIEDPAEWTFIVYLDADNNLEGAGIEDMNELETVGSTENVNIVVLFDRTLGEDTSNGDWTGTRRYLVQKDENTEMLAEYTEGVNVWGSEEEDELNMGDPETLVNFTTWAMDTFPAKKYFLDFWNHGGAFWGVCWDDSTSAEGDCINMTELSQGLSGITRHLGRKIDAIGFDACLMAQVAVLHQISDYCDVAVASAFSEPGDGWPYELFMPELAADPQMTPQELGSLLVDTYITSYTDRQQDPSDSFQVSMGAFDMNKFPEVARKLNEFGMLLATGGPNSNTGTYYLQLKMVRDDTKSYDILHVGPFDIGGYCMYDLIDFLDNLEKPKAAGVYPVVQDVAVELRAAANEAIISSKANLAQFNAHCLMFYFPSGRDTAYDERYSATKYASEMFWDEFLHHYDDETFEDDFPPSVYINEPTEGTAMDEDATAIEVKGKSYDVQNSVIQVQVRIDDGEWMNAQGTVDWHLTVPTSDLGAGEHIVSARSFDGSSYSPVVSKSIEIQEQIVEEPVQSEDNTWMYAAGVIGLACIVAAAAMVWKRRTLPT